MEKILLLNNFEGTHTIDRNQCSRSSHFTRNPCQKFLTDSNLLNSAAKCHCCSYRDEISHLHCYTGHPHRYQAVQRHHPDRVPVSMQSFNAASVLHTNQLVAGTGLAPLRCRPTLALRSRPTAALLVTLPATPPRLCRPRLMPGLAKSTMLKH